MTEFVVSYVYGVYRIARPGQDGVALTADEAEALFEFTGRSTGVLTRYDYMIRTMYSFVRAFINWARAPEYYNAPDTDAAELACQQANDFNVRAAGGWSRFLKG